MLKLVRALGSASGLAGADMWDWQCSTMPTSLFDKDFPFRTFQESWFRFYCRSTFHHKNNMSRQCRAWMSPQLPEERILSDLSSLPWSAWSLWPETISPWNMEEYHQLTTSHWLDWCTCIKHKKQCVMQSYTSPTRKSLIRRLCFAASKNHPSTIPKTCCTTQPAGWHNLILRRLRNAWTQKGRVYGSSHVLCPLSFLDVRGTKESKGQQMTNVHKFSAC